jgi:hypothetical protein
MEQGYVEHQFTALYPSCHTAYSPLPLNFRRTNENSPQQEILVLYLFYGTLQLEQGYVEHQFTALYPSCHTTYSPLPLSFRRTNEISPTKNLYPFLNATKVRQQFTALHPPCHTSFPWPRNALLKVNHASRVSHPPPLPHPDLENIFLQVINEGTIVILIQAFKDFLSTSLLPTRNVQIADFARLFAKYTGVFEKTHIIYVNHTVHEIKNK